jgi:hypothetical protein
VKDFLKATDRTLSDFFFRIAKKELHHFFTEEETKENNKLFSGQQV